MFQKMHVLQTRLLRTTKATAFIFVIKHPLYFLYLIFFK